MEWENVLQVKQTSGTLPPRELNESDSQSIHGHSPGHASTNMHAQRKGVEWLVRDA